MTEAHHGTASTGDDDSMSEGEQLGIVTVEIPKNLQVRAWHAKILKGKKIKDLICKGLDRELRRLHL